MRDSDLSLSSKIRICRVATSPFFFRHHLRSTIEAILASGYELTLVTSEGEGLEELRKINGVKVVVVNIERDIKLIEDLKSLFRLFSFFRRNSFDIIHSCTPKAGLLTSIAGFFARVPLRFHTFTGQAWLLKPFLTKKIAMICDRIMLLLNTMCYADGYSQVEELIRLGISKPGKIRILGKGSLSGIDIKKFDTSRFDEEDNLNLKKDLGIPQDSVVISFVGRLNTDKGIEELVDAFYSINREFNKLYLVVVGPPELTKGALSPQVMEKLAAHENIKMIGYTPQPEKYLSISDIFCLPSYREGFPNVILEAAMMGVPSVGTDVVGVKDTIIENETGVFAKAQNSKSLEQALRRLIDDAELRKKLALKAKDYVVSNFTEEKVNSLILDEYRRAYQKLSLSLEP